MGLPHCLVPSLLLRRSFSHRTSAPSPLLVYKPTGCLQKTLASTAETSGVALHSGARTTVRLSPASAGAGRFFISRSATIPATIGFASDSPLCTTLRKGAAAVRTVEHLLFALETSGVDNCRIEIEGGDEVPIFDGSAKVWMELIERAGLVTAEDPNGNGIDRMAPVLVKPFYLQRKDSFLAAFPSPRVRITYGIDFARVPAIGCQWFSCFPVDNAAYTVEIAHSRTFCILDEVVKLYADGLIQGGSLENALVCSPDDGWLNPPLHSYDEPCRHKVLDLVGDLSLFAQNGSQGLPVAHVIAYKGGHSLHAELVRRIIGWK